MSHGYHLKELVWFNGWTPTHWLLLETPDGLKARCTRASDAPTLEHDTAQLRSEEQILTDDMLARIEKVVPGSLPAIMGFEFLLCDGPPGSSVLNRPLNFRTSTVAQAETVAV